LAIELESGAEYSTQQQGAAIISTPLNGGFVSVRKVSSGRTTLKVFALSSEKRKQRPGHVWDLEEVIALLPK
jgi:hypothetical protein